MADEVGRDLPPFLASVLDKMENICQNDMGEGTAKAHAEVINQRIRTLISISDSSLLWYSSGRVIYHLFKSSHRS